jgi:hypothetical protein
MLNLSSTSKTHMDLFKFFGVFLGHAIRSQQSYDLDLSSTFWKLLLNSFESQSAAENENDLKSFDLHSWTFLKSLREQAANLTDEEFDSEVQQTFVTLLSNAESF